MAAVVSCSAQSRCVNKLGVIFIVAGRVSHVAEFVAQQTAMLHIGCHRYGGGVKADADDADTVCQLA